MSQKNPQELQQMIERLERRVDVLEQELRKMAKTLLAQNIVVKLPRRTE